MPKLWPAGWGSDVTQWDEGRLWVKFTAGWMELVCDALVRRGASGGSSLDRRGGAGV